MSGTVLRIRLWSLLLALCWSFAAAQDCLPEFEPNDTPADANDLGALSCALGELPGQDQDAYWWTVGEEDAQRFWTMTVEGIPGQLTRVDVVAVTFDADGNVTAADTLSTFGTRDGSLQTSDPFLIAPGRYLLGVAKSGGEGSYVVRFAPGLELRSGRRELERTDEIEHAFAGHGTLDGDKELAWILDAEDAAQRWQLELLGPVGIDLELIVLGPDGARVTGGSTDGARLALPSLGLEAGTYRLTIAGGEEGAPYALAASPQGFITDGNEIEPNDDWDRANALTFERPLVGGGGNSDYYVFEVGPEQAGRAFDLVVEADAALRVGLYDDARNQLQRRDGQRGALRGLTLEPGNYGIYVDTDAERYELRFEPAAPPQEGFESEPNDLLLVADPLTDELTVRGVLQPQDEDVFRFGVAGEPQLWRVQVLGQGRITITTYNGGGARQQSLSGERRVRLDNLLLLPGEHFVEVAGDEGEYALRILPLGPAPEPPPPDPAAAEAPLEAAPAPPAEDAAAEATAAPLGPPPPPGLLESEPNDDDSRAELLEAGVVRVGVLAEADDRDLYRFYLANDQYVRIEAVPPAGGELFFDLSSARRFEARTEGGAAVMERWLPAGDHVLILRPATAAAGFYQLRMRQLDPLALPDDVEPNDEEEGARPLPLDLTVEGEVGAGADRDFYELPLFPVATGMRIEATLDDGVRLTLLGADGVRLDEEDGVHGALLPADTATRLRVNGTGDYRLVFAFDTPPDPTELRANDALADTELSFAEARAEVTAYWFRGQRYDTELTLVNRSDERRSYALEAASSHFTVQPRLADDVTLAPGERTTLPLSVQLPSDVRDDQPIRITVAARSAAGVATAALTLEPTCAAPPRGSGLHWPLPDELLGGINVLWNAFGGSYQSESNRAPNFFDGLTSPATGGYLELDLPIVVDLPGNQPIELAGTLLHPQASGDVSRHLRGFEVQVSLDGERFETVLRGELAAAQVEQGFVFAEPVAARYARLRMLSSHGGGAAAYVGEWKLVATEPDPLGEIDVADPALGGHVVWSDPLLPNSGQRSVVLTPDEDAPTIDARAHDEAVWVVGFHHDRAARIERIEWFEQPDSPAEERFERVVVEVSLSSPVGPWRELADWTLERDPDGVAVLDLAAPEWARYLRFTAPKPPGSERRFHPPDRLRVIESPAGDDYRSAVGEWGHYGRDAVFELLTDAAASAEFEADDNDSLETAQFVAAGEAIEGDVLVAEDVDWFRFTVAEGENLLEIRLAGDPTVNYRYELFDAAGAPVAFDVEEDGDRLVLRHFGAPGDYLLRLEEPKRSVIFSWDTSGSVAPYQAITYNSLARFARDLDPEREFVQLLAYDDPTPKWLLPYWSADPLRVQSTINEFDRDADSSNSENALLTASEALFEREGTRAVLLMTDAESPGYTLTSRLWRSLERSRPRVFTFEISTGGTDYAQDLMQSWARVNSGFYDYARNVGDFDVGFARAACLLRRPKRYRLEVTTAFREPPGPGALRIGRGEGGALPAVEVIFDASGSMGKLLPSGVSRIETAKRVLTEFVTEVLPDGAGFALRAYGHIAPSSCETRLDVPLAPLDRDEALAAIAAIEPKLLSQTPIADSLLAVAGDLAAATGPTTVVLLTDGLESCDGDPQAAVEELRAAGIDVQLAIISLGLEDPEDVAAFEALAEAVGASYVDAQDLATLESSITAALRPPFEVLDAAGEVVARGVVEGEGVELPAGIYTVRVLTSPIEVFREVRVPAETTVRLTLGER